MCLQYVFETAVVHLELFFHCPVPVNEMHLVSQFSSTVKFPYSIQLVGIEVLSFTLNLNLHIEYCIAYF